MKFKIAFTATITALMFVSCSNEILSGDKGEIKEKAATLTLTIKNRNYTTKAIEDGTLVAGDDSMYNYVVYVFNSDGNLNVAPKYFEVTDASNAQTQSVNILINPGTDMEVYVVANTGNPMTPGNPLFGLSTKIDLETIRWNFADTAMVGGKNNNETPIVQTGSNIITGDATAGYTADVILNIVPMCISLETISLFGEEKQSVNGDTNAAEGTAEKLAANAGITSIAIESISMLNAEQYSLLFPLGNYYINDFNIINGFDVAAFTGGTYYPPYPHNTTNVVGSLTQYINTIPITSGARPFFCVGENRYAVDSNIDAVTLVVITCSVVSEATGGTSAIRYFTIPLNQILAQSGISGFSAKHGYHIKLTVNIASEGQTNPYTPTSNFALTVKPNAFSDASANVNFPEYTTP